jgi:hypothetical protein
MDGRIGPLHSIRELVGCMERRMDGWVSRWMDGWMDGWMDRLMDVMMDKWGPPHSTRDG